MLGLTLGVQPQYPVTRPVTFPIGFAWDRQRFNFDITEVAGQFTTTLSPRAIVDPAIWSGALFHVAPNGDDDNSGLGAITGDFGQAKRTIAAAFVAGNATNAPYRVLVKAGQYEGSAFTRNGNDEPTQPVAVLAHGGRVSYRTGPFAVSWRAAGAIYAAAVSSVRRVFRTDMLTPEGHYIELSKVADVTVCAATLSSWAWDGSDVHVNIGAAPGPSDIALIRSFHGARFMQHDRDFYIEGFDIEGGITGALHFDKTATRTIVGVDCTFRYSAPSNVASPQDAVRIRRTDGLVAFFNCDASCGAKDGWSFHDDGVLGMHVLLQNCTSARNGAFDATSVNGFTLHDRVYAISLNGVYGFSQNGSEVHSIQNAQAWIAGGQITACDQDGSSTAIKCSNASQMWLQNVIADADGSVANYGIEANGGTVFTRNVVLKSGTVEVSSGGSVTPF